MEIQLPRLWHLAIPRVDAQNLRRSNRQTQIYLLLHPTLPPTWGWNKKWLDLFRKGFFTIYSQSWWTQLFPWIRSNKLASERQSWRAKVPARNNVSESELELGGFARWNFTSPKKIRESAFALRKRHAGRPWSWGWWSNVAKTNFVSWMADFFNHHSKDVVCFILVFWDGKWNGMTWSNPNVFGDNCWNNLVMPEIWRSISMELGKPLWFLHGLKTT